MTTTLRSIEGARESELDEQKTLARILHYIDRPPANSRVFKITPMIAEILLRDYNTRNRPKKPMHIARYAADMASDCWPVTGDTVKFSDANRLADGQNRLMACVRSGVPFVTHIVFGIVDDAFNRLDQGRNRDGADVLHNAGFQNTNQLVAAVRWIHLVENGRAKQRDTYQPPQILRLLQERYSSLGDFVKQGRSIYVTSGQPIGIVTAMLYLFHKANTSKADEFCAAWETGQLAGKYKPLGLMTGRLAQLKSSTSGRVHDVVRAALIVTAWNLFIMGRKGRGLDMLWDPAQPFPEIKRGNEVA